jgi:molecular chaperone DnaK (HSP70)
MTFLKVGIDLGTSRSAASVLKEGTEKDEQPSSI